MARLAVIPGGACRTHDSGLSSEYSFRPEFRIVKKQVQYLFPAIAFLSLLALTCAPVHAGDNQIRIPLPPMPKIVLPAPPPMIWLPVPKVYVAHESPYPIFFHSGRYYLHDHDSWYIGPGYAGPWTTVHHKKVPKNLRAFRKDNWGQYQSEAAHHFHSDRYEREPFYARREAREQHRRADWREYDERHDHGKHERKEKKEKKEKHGKHGHDD